MLRIAITGNISSGKTTVTEIFKNMKISVISADKLMRSFQQPGQMLWRKIKNKWGDKYVKKNGILDREKMAADLIVDEKFKKQIEEMSHPLIISEILKIFSVWESEGEGLAVCEVPLLFEAEQKYKGLLLNFDVIILTVCDEDIRIKRIMSNRGIDRRTAEKWLKIQIPQSEITNKVDFVIDTKYNLKSVEQKVGEIIETIKRRIGNNEDN